MNNVFDNFPSEVAMRRIIRDTAKSGQDLTTYAPEGLRKSMQELRLWLFFTVLAVVDYLGAAAFNPEKAIHFGWCIVFGCGFGYFIRLSVDEVYAYEYRMTTSSTDDESS
jgi:hypothetical protein